MSHVGQPVSKLLFIFFWNAVCFTQETHLAKCSNFVMSIPKKSWGSSKLLLENLSQGFYVLFGQWWFSLLPMEVIFVLGESFILSLVLVGTVFLVSLTMVPAILWFSGVPKALEIVLVTCLRIIVVGVFVSHLFFHFYFSCHYVFSLLLVLRHQ